MADAAQRRIPQFSAFLGATGARIRRTLAHIGNIWFLLLTSTHWLWRALTNKRIRLGRSAIVTQMVRVGVGSIVIVGLVAGAVGFILGLQMAPPLDDLGQVRLVPNIIAVAVLRELGPLISAIVLTGFAGAAIAAEIGTMVVGEEIEALEAHALNPVRFLVVPRLIATTISLTLIAIIANVVALAAGTVMGVTVLDIPLSVYLENTIDQVGLRDFLTGIFKAAVFGLLIGLIACENGLKVTGGAAGVGRATTSTVVESIMAIIVADLVFTAVFYTIGWT
ncbi:MAG: ABC transporter permease [Phycisphaerales bacterium]|nr:MAG: ABC transporter permease [Phycisphaerales bacterium]